LSAANGTYDAIVVGAGHNGLTAACVLAKGGRRVVVLERRDVAGGMCAGEEFHPGYRSAGLLHDTTCVRPWVIDALSLREHGLSRAQRPLEVFSPQTRGRGLRLSTDPAVSADEIGAHCVQDSGRYASHRRFVERIRGVVSDLVNDLPPDWRDIGAGGAMSLLRRAASLRRLGGRVMIEMTRAVPMSVADYLNGHFETDILKSSLAAPALLGGWAGPRSPGTATPLILWECLAGPPVEGGPAAVASALGRAAKHLGVVVRSSCEVERIRVGKSGVEGVRLSNDEEIDAPLVLSSADPRTTFLRLLAPGTLSPKFEARIRSWRSRGTTAKVHLALDRPLEFACRPGEACEYARTGENLDQMERAFDPVKYRSVTGAPLLEIFVPSVSRPELAPDGHAVVSVMAHFVPYHYDAGWTDEERERLGEAVVAALEVYAPGVRASIVAREVLTPLDIEQRYGVSGGHIHHGEQGLDQIAARPAPEAARYATPVKGLFLCGSGAHAGGGVSCAPGALAARAAAGAA
jgi:phytoene dehydrogenase-like protein